MPRHVGAAGPGQPRLGRAEALADFAIPDAGRVHVPEFVNLRRADDANVAAP